MEVDGYANVANTNQGSNSQNAGEAVFNNLTISNIESRKTTSLTMQASGSDKIQSGTLHASPYEQTLPASETHPMTKQDQLVLEPIDSDANALTFSQTKSSRSQKTEPKDTDDLSKPVINERESLSPPSPKKVKSAGEIVKESMKSKRITNTVETRVILQPTQQQSVSSPTKESAFFITSTTESQPRKSDQNISTQDTNAKVLPLDKQQIVSKTIINGNKIPQEKVSKTISPFTDSSSEMDSSIEKEIKIGMDQPDYLFSDSQSTSKKSSSPTKESPIPQSTFMERKIETSKVKSDSGLSSTSVSTQLKSSQTQILELPPNGWYLKEAIDKKLFDPKMGMFTIPGTDRLVSFEETIRLQIINHKSAQVVEPGRSNKKADLVRAINKGFLDSTGHYNSDSLKRKLTMREAIVLNLITFEERTEPYEINQNMTTKVLKIISNGEKPDQIDVVDSSELPLSGYDIPETTIFKSEETLSKSTQEQFIEIENDIYYSPTSDTILFHKTGERINLMKAIRDNRIDPKLFFVKDLDSKKDYTLDKAIKKGIVDRKTGELVSKKSNKKIPIKEMLKSGVLALVAAPAVFVDTLASSISSSSHEHAISRSVVSDDGSVRPKSSSPHKIVESEGVGTTKVLRETVQIIKSREIFVKDPQTGKEIPLDDAVNKGLISEEAANALKNNDEPASGFKTEKKVQVTITDPATGSQLPLNLAVRRGIIDAETAKRIQRGEVVENVVRSNVVVESPEQRQKSILHSEPEKTLRSPSPPKSPPKTRSIDKGKSEKATDNQTSSPLGSPKSRKSPPKSSPLTEPKFSVSLGKARSIQSPEREVRIQKISKRTLTPKYALQEGLIDKEAENILSNAPNIPLELAISQGKIDGDKGAVLNPQTGEKLTIYQALKMGLIDSETKSLRIPIGRSLSLPSLVNKGLYDQKEKRIIHPETGQLLTLEQAISCDIVDGHSKLIEPKTKKPIELEAAIQKGIVDGITGAVTTASERRMSLVEAVRTNYISLPSSMVIPNDNEIENKIPLLSLTKTAAFNIGLIDEKTLEFKHPIFNETMPLQKAKDKQYISEVKDFQLSKEFIDFIPSESEVDGRKSPQKLSPKIRKKSPERKDIKKRDSIEKDEQFDDKEKVIFSIDSKSQSQMSASVVTTTMETVITSKGEVTLKASSALQSFAEAIKSGHINLAKGTYTIPSTNEELTISEALRRNILQSQELTPKKEDKDKDKDKDDKYTVTGAFTWLYDEESKKFKEPQTGDLISFEELVNKGHIDMDAVIYDSASGTTKTTKEAIEQGQIDLQSGCLVDDKTKDKISITDAAKLGLIAVIGSPILAGQAVSGFLFKSQGKSTKGTSTIESFLVPPKSTASIKSQTEVNDEEISTTTTVTTTDLRTYNEVRKE